MTPTTEVKLNAAADGPDQQALTQIEADEALAQLKAITQPQTLTLAKSEA